MALSLFQQHIFKVSTISLHQSFRFVTVLPGYYFGLLVWTRVNGDLNTGVHISWESSEILKLWLWKGKLYFETLQSTFGDYLSITSITILTPTFLRFDRTVTSFRIGSVSLCLCCHFDWEGCVGKEWREDWLRTSGTTIEQHASPAVCSIQLNHKLTGASGLPPTYSGLDLTDCYTRTASGPSGILIKSFAERFHSQNIGVKCITAKGTLLANCPHSQTTISGARPWKLGGRKLNSGK